MKRPLLFSLCLVLLLSFSAASTAVLIGEGPVELNQGESVNITPINGTEPYEVPQTTVLGALDRAAVLGAFEYQVAEDLPPEEGNLSIFSITDVENEVVNGTPNNWTYWVNGEEGTTGPAVTDVTDGDNVTYSYGPPGHTPENASYTLFVNVSVPGGGVTPEPTGNVTPEPTGNVTPEPTGNVTPEPTGNVTPEPTGNVTPEPTGNVTPEPTGNVTPEPTGNVTPEPTGNVTPEPTTGAGITAEIAAGLSGEGNLTTFVGALNNSTLDQKLEQNRTYLVCAPTNDAFEGLGNQTLAAIMNNTTLLNTIIEYHVIQGDYTIEELIQLCQNSTDGQISLPTVEGTDVNVSLTDDNQLVINNIAVVTQIPITNSITVYVIDGVLIPSGAQIPPPTGNVTPTPTGNVTPEPTGNVTPEPTGNVTPEPTGNVTPEPTGNVTPEPTGNVTPEPTGNVTPEPTGNVTPEPTGNVTPTPTGNVTPTPTGNVTPEPTGNVTPEPTGNVTPEPTGNVTPEPTGNVTPEPTGNVTPTPGESVDLELYEGWNFVSIPRQLSTDNNTVATVFGDVDTDGRPIYTFEPETGFTPVGENETLEVLEGYWVYSTNETTLQLNLSTDPIRSPAARTLSPGWNAIGYSDLTERPANETLGSVEDAWVYVVGFDAETQSYRPALINNQTGAQGEDQSLSPTEGYWLFMSEEGRLAAIST